MIVLIGLTAVLALIFAVFGVAKLLAVAPMRELAAKAGFSTAAYRGIGAAEVAGAVGVALGPVVPLFGAWPGPGCWCCSPGR